jgi:hypothetical protein
LSLGRVNAFLEKPVDPDILIQTVKKTLDGPLIEVGNSRSSVDA